jgi:prolyl-tRNA editing enzyme YbaK/EbsC (Cys-tRNA(Pro) deacylase)
MSSSVQRVQAALVAAGVTARVVELPQSTRSAREAASAIGCEVEQIAKSLVFRRLDNDEPVLVIAGGQNRVDEQLLSAHLQAPIAKADAEFVRRTTGFAIGGVPPLGHATPVRTLIDRDLLDLDVIWAAAGTPHAVVSLTPQQLLAATGGQVVQISSSTGGRPE